jgi:hypothetical protein
MQTAAIGLNREGQESVSQMGQTGWCVFSFFLSFVSWDTKEPMKNIPARMCPIRTTTSDHYYFKE